MQEGSKLRRCLSNLTDANSATRVRACGALGRDLNTAAQAPTAADAVAGRLGDRDPKVRKAAAQALVRLDARHAAPKLAYLCFGDADGSVRAAAAHALGELAAASATASADRSDRRAGRERGAAALLAAAVEPAGVAAAVLEGGRRELGDLGEAVPIEGAQPFAPAPAPAGLLEGNDAGGAVAGGAGDGGGEAGSLAASRGRKTSIPITAISAKAETKASAAAASHAAPGRGPAGAHKHRSPTPPAAPAPLVATLGQAARRSDAKRRRPAKEEEARDGGQPSATSKGGAASQTRPQLSTRRSTSDSRSGGGSRGSRAAKRRLRPAAKLEPPEPACPTQTLRAATATNAARTADAAGGVAAVTPGATGAAPQPLTPEAKAALQARIDELNNVQIERVIAFLEPDLIDGSESQVEMDLDKLPSERQHALVQFVDAELSAGGAGPKGSAAGATPPADATPLEAKQGARATRAWEVCSAREVQRQSHLREVRQAASVDCTPLMTPLANAEEIPGAGDARSALPPQPEFALLPTASPRGLSISAAAPGATSGQQKPGAAADAPAGAAALDAAAATPAAGAGGGAGAGCANGQGAGGEEAALLAAAGRERGAAALLAAAVEPAGVAAAVLEGGRRELGDLDEAAPIEGALPLAPPALAPAGGFGARDGGGEAGKHAGSRGRSTFNPITAISAKAKTKASAAAKRRRPAKEAEAGDGGEPSATGGGGAASQTRARLSTRRSTSDSNSDGSSRSSSTSDSRSDGGSRSSRAAKRRLRPAAKLEPAGPLQTLRAAAAANAARTVAMGDAAGGVAAGTAGAAGAAPQPLTPEAKAALQVRIDELNDVQVERVIAFLDPDLIEGSTSQVEMDLDKLPSERQHALVQLVDELRAGGAGPKGSAAGATPPADATPLEAKPPKPAGPMQTLRAAAAANAARTAAMGDAVGGAAAVTAGAAGAALQPLTPEAKAALQARIDELNDVQIERVIAFLEPDLTDGSAAQVEMDLDKLPSERQHALVQFVDAELRAGGGGPTGPAAGATPPADATPLEAKQGTRAARAWEVCSAREAQRQSHLREVRQAASLGGTPLVTPLAGADVPGAGDAGSVLPPLPEFALPPATSPRGPSTSAAAPGATAGQQKPAAAADAPAGAAALDAAAADAGGGGGAGCASGEGAGGEESPQQTPRPPASVEQFAPLLAEPKSSEGDSMLDNAAAVEELLHLVDMELDWR